MSTMPAPWPLCDGKRSQDFGDRHAAHTAPGRAGVEGITACGDLQQVLMMMPLYQLERIAQWFKDYARSQD